MYVVVHARRYGGVLMYGDIHVCGCTCTYVWWCIDVWRHTCMWLYMHVGMVVY